MRNVQLSSRQFWNCGRWSSNPCNTDQTILFYNDFHVWFQFVFHCWFRTMKINWNNIRKKFIQPLKNPKFQTENQTFRNGENTFLTVVGNLLHVCKNVRQFLLISAHHWTLSCLLPKNIILFHGYADYTDKNRPKGTFWWSVKQCPLLGALLYWKGHCFSKWFPKGTVLAPSSFLM